MECLASNCSVMVCMGGPFCQKHTNEFYSVVIKPTLLEYNSIKLSFEGLFASRNFEINEKIIPYFHLCLFLAPSTAACSIAIPDPYSIVINGSTHSALQYRCSGAFANTVLKRPRMDELGRKVSKSSKTECNVDFQKQKNEVDLVATKQICKGQELLVDYGSKRSEFLDVWMKNSPILINK